MKCWRIPSRELSTIPWVGCCSSFRKYHDSNAILLGSNAVNAEGWEVIHRNANPHEIREEYERLKKEKEERRLQTLTNPKGSITLHVNATDIFNPYDNEFE